MKPIYLRTASRHNLADPVSLSRMMFLDYKVVVDEIKTVKERDEYSQRLDWLLSKGEEKKASMDCPFCESRKIRVFGWDVSRDGSFHVGPELTSCMNGRCREKLHALLCGVKGGIREIKFSAMITLARDKRERRKISDLYRQVFNVPRNISDREALDFFRN